MKNKFSIFKTILVFFAVWVLTPQQVSAHQPRITESRLTQVPDPEISKAYYGKLTGQPDIYVIDSQEPFNLYVNILVPKIPDQQKNVSVVVTKVETQNKQIAFLDAKNSEWKEFYEPFGADTYYMGPEYEAPAEAGKYEIQVSSPDNTGKYSLAIGKIEAFDGKETLNALTLIPKLKKTFFEKSPVDFIKSPFGYGLIIVTYLLAVIFGLLYRIVLKRFAKGTVRGVGKNIGKKDRLLRLAIGAVLLIWAITTSWSPSLLFFSGFAFFEAIFSWCGFYAAIGKNTCPV